MSGDRVIFVVGPTASGKSDLAAAIAKELSGVVISADSMQIYRGMHIASAAPDKEDMQGIEHKLIEFLPYGAKFSVSDYADMARAEIKKCLAAGKTPVVTGGTGLYINALADNIHFLPVKTDAEIRRKLSDEFDRVGGEEMIKRLSRIDSAAAGKLNPADRRRIIRAFEIYETSGITKTKQNEFSRRVPTEWEPVMIGLTCKDREKLYERINRRVDKMIENGLIEEARSAMRIKTVANAAQAIGHKELFGYLAGSQSLEEAVENLKRATRRYAKRQLTWFNKDGRIHWIYRDTVSDILSEAMRIIEEGEK